MAKTFTMKYYSQLRRIVASPIIAFVLGSDRLKSHSNINKIITSARHTKQHPSDSFALIMHKNLINDNSGGVGEN